MEPTTGFFQELYVSLPAHQLSSHERFSIHVTETCDSENYRIEWLNGNNITYWEGEDWHTVLAECINDLQAPF